MGKYWYKIETYEGDGNYHHLGSSEFTIEELAKKLERGEYIKLNDLLYRDDDQIKNWADWDKRFHPIKMLNPKYVVAIMEFTGDPRNYPKPSITPIK